MKDEIIISISFLIILMLFLNPLGLWMPTTLTYMMLVGLIVVFAIFVSFLWKERAYDEREELHRRISARVGYITGMSVLMLGIIVESIISHSDPWLIIVLGAMVFGKIAGQLYVRTHE